MSEKEFQGDKKLPMRSFLARGERKLIDAWVPKFPRWIEGYHLTLTTILWAAGVIVFGYLAQRNVNWLWGSSVMLFMQWFTDSFDGALGRYRDTGIPKWGYYMDHLLDYVFLCALVIGYSFLFEGREREIIFFLIPIFGCFMVSAYLAFGSTSEFKITYMGTGPTEMRIWFILINCSIIFFGVEIWEKVLPYLIPVSGAILIFIVYRTQRYIWKVDRGEKKSKEE